MEIPRFGVPVDAAQWGAAALGAIAIGWGVAARYLVAARRSAQKIGELALRHERIVVAAIAVIAALLSWGYVGAYLRGGPRIIDATSYWLEARGLAAGRVRFPVGPSETSVLGRFLVRSEDPSGVFAAVLFPPGYPALLALGFLAGAPLLVGPALAALLVIATFALAKEVVREAPGGAMGTGTTVGTGEGARSTDGAFAASRAGRFAGVPLCAAALSGACAALRYHTAETMSHGLAALCFTLSVALLLRARRRPASPRRWALASMSGLFAGWLFATRPASGLALGVTALAVVILDRPEEKPHRARLADAARWLLAVLAGALPLMVLFAVHQRIATGQWGTTTHAAHYALDDGPAGCFRYGFGEGIGCYGEHGDFVRANLPRGFGFVAAVKTTARRLWMHLVDAGNLELLALLVPIGAALAWELRRARILAIAIVAQIAAYAPFYFDGNYPGGGARLFADVLPFEHVLLAIAAVAIAVPSRAGSSGAVPMGAPAFGTWVVAASLVGFGVRAGFDHAQLRDRDGGAPLFSAREVDLESASIQGEPRLVFADTDAAFDLAFDPRPGALVEVVRWRGDALDAFVWRERWGVPAFVARFVTPPGGGRGHSILEPYRPTENPPWVEGGSLWPPRAQEGGVYALPAFAGGTCAVAKKLLRVVTSGGKRGTGTGEVRLGLPAKMVGGRTIDVGLFVLPRGLEGRGEAAIVVDGARTTASIAIPAEGEPACVRGQLTLAVPLGAKRVEIALSPSWEGDADPERQPIFALDRVDFPEATAGAEPASPAATDG